VAIKMNKKVMIICECGYEIDLDKDLSTADQIHIICDGSKQIVWAGRIITHHKDMLSKSSDNGDDSIIRKWNREMKNVNDH
jgi:hypothetical protein